MSNKKAEKSEKQIEDLETLPLKVVFNTQQERPAAGQILTPPTGPTLQKKRKSVKPWQILALVAAVFLIILSSVFLNMTKRLVPLRIPDVTPTSVPQQNNLMFTDIKMISTTDGWAKVRSTSLKGTKLYTIAHTNNGGISWQVFNFNEKPAGIMGSTGLFFLDGQTAWVALGASDGSQDNVTVMHTIDGGQHWITQTFPPTRGNMQFLDQQHGWSWFSSQSYAGEDITGEIYQTSDGGTTWTKISTTSTDRTFDDPTPGPLPFSQAFSLSFQTLQRGWATLSSQVAVPSFSQSTQRNYLYMTQDGGVTWSLQQLPQPTTGPIPGIHTALTGDFYDGLALIETSMPVLFSSQQGILWVASQEGRQKPRVIYLYTTNDGGSTWSPSGAPIYDKSDFLLPIVILDTTHLILSDNYKYTLGDNGTWQQQYLLQVGRSPKFSFIDSQRGWATYDDGGSNDVVSLLYVTSDGGQTWHIVMEGIMPLPV